MERWRPRTEQDILSAIANGTLEETHYLEVKSELKWSEGAKKEFARDLAQFAVDGGHIIIGLLEDKPNRTWLPKPLPDPDVKDIRERIEQVASMKVDPPLPVIVTLIQAAPSTSDPALPDSPPSGHYVVIEIAPSAVAPHMVEGRYYSRGESMKMTLSDAEVLRLHSSRRDQNQLIKEMLRAEIDRDPVAGGPSSGLGRVYLVAHPVLGTSEMAIDLVRGPESVIRHVVSTADASVPERIRTYEPSLGSAFVLASRASGVALHTHTVQAGRVVPSELELSNALDVELDEDGSIRIFMGRATIVSPNGTEQIVDDLAVAYAMRLVALARGIADQVSHRGPWQFGIAITGLKGLRAYTPGDFGRNHGPTYDRDAYQQTAEATRVELDDVNLVAGRLVLRLLRSLGTVASSGAALR